jgi:hypothetical protein
MSKAHTAIRRDENMSNHCMQAFGVVQVTKITARWKWNERRPRVSAGLHN